MQLLCDFGQLCIPELGERRWSGSDPTNLVQAPSTVAALLAEAHYAKMDRETGMSHLEETP